MGKKDNHNMNPYELTGPFRILLKGGQLFVGEVKGAWDNALLIGDIHNGDCIVFLDTVAVMMEGLQAPTQEEQGPTEEEQKGGE